MVKKIFKRKTIFDQYNVDYNKSLIFLVKIYFELMNVNVGSVGRRNIN